MVSWAVMANTTIYAQDHSQSYILISLARRGKKALALEASCSCVLREHGRATIKKSFEVQKQLLRSLDWNLNNQNSIRKSIVFIFQLKLLIKRPSLFWATHFHISKFSLVNQNNCWEHGTNLDDSCWFSPSASGTGFPWSYDSFANSLDFLRNKKFKYFVFRISSGEEGPDLFEPKIPVRNLSLMTKGIHLKNLPADGWTSVEFFEGLNFEVLHGSVIVKNNKFLATNSRQSKVRANMAPTSIWERNHEGSPDIKLFASPESTKTSTLAGTTLFIDSYSGNYYHFLSESIQPLIYVLENKMEVSQVLIREDLPYQFYEFLRFMTPEVELVTAKKNTTYFAERLIFARNLNPLGNNDDLFRNVENLEIEKSDEFRTWNYLRRASISANQASEDTNKDLLVYLPRSKESSRGILFSELINKVLKYLGIVTVDATNLSFEEQLKIYRNVRLLLSSTGASLINSIFIPSKALLIELCFDKQISWGFLNKFIEIEYHKIYLQGIGTRKVRQVLDVYFLSPIKINKVRKIIKKLQ